MLSKIFQGDRVIWSVYFLLCVISLVEVFSAGSSLTYETGDVFAPLMKQAAFLSLGTLVVIFIQRIPCRFFRIIPVLLVPLSVLLLLLTFFVGITANDSQRWLGAGGFSFQPSEFAKLAVVTVTALLLSRGQTEEGVAVWAFKWILITVGIMGGLVFPENFSTAMLMFGVAFLMMFIGRVQFLQLGKIVGVFFATGLLVFFLVQCLPEDSSIMTSGPLHRASTWVNRITTKGKTSDIDDPKDYNLKAHPQEGYANIAIASSNVVGKMPGNSEERDHLAQAYSDFIYAIIIEEMGIWGACGVAFLYIVLLFRCGRIANRCKDKYFTFLVMGLSLMMVAQAVLNMLVAVGLFPVTGQPLPLISRGGTSTLFTSVYFGMILSVSFFAKRMEQVPEPA